MREGARQWKDSKGCRCQCHLEIRKDFSSRKSDMLSSTGGFDDCNDDAEFPFSQAATETELFLIESVGVQSLVVAVVIWAAGRSLGRGEKEALSTACGLAAMVQIVFALRTLLGSRYKKLKLNKELLVGWYVALLCTSVLI